MTELPAVLFLPIPQRYEPRFKPNAFLDKLPRTYKEASSCSGNAWLRASAALL